MSVTGHYSTSNGNNDETLDEYITLDDWYIDNITVEQLLLLAPENVQIVYSGTDVNITWDVVENAGSYLIYSATDPYSTFTQIGTSFTNLWNGTEGSNKYFYKIIATTDTSK